MWSGSEELNDLLITFKLGILTSNENIRNIISIRFAFDNEISNNYIERLKAIITNIWNPIEFEVFIKT